MKGRVAVLKAYGGEFELREYPVPDPEPGRDPDQADPRGRVRLRSPHLAWGDEGDVRRAAQGPHLRPRDVRAGRAARRRHHHGLDGPPAARGRPRDLLLLLPVRALPGVPERRDGQLPAEGPAEPGRGHRALLQQRLRRLLLPPAEPLHLQAARRDSRGHGHADQLRAVPGAVRAAQGGVPRGAVAGGAGRGRARRQRGGGGAGHGRGHRHRGGPARRSGSRSRSRSGPTTP